MGLLLAPQKPSSARLRHNLIDFHPFRRIIVRPRETKLAKLTRMDGTRHAGRPLRCPKCGSNKFVVPDHSTGDSLVTCADCGAGIGRWGDVRVGILEEAETERKGAARRQKAKRNRAAA